MFSPELMQKVRDRFAHVERCPFEGERIFFENAGGALTLKSVVETSATFAAIPDNQGRTNGASARLMEIIAKSKADTMLFLNAQEGQVFVGESGTELLFRLIRSAVVASPKGGNVVGTTLEHPASRSAARHWAKETARDYLPVVHDNETGSVTAEAYSAVVTPETRVATIVHTSPVTGMGVDVGRISKAIRKISPDCFIIVDGIQHAAHGGLDIASYHIDGYVISPYKCFSRHGYGTAWVSDRLSTSHHERLIGSPEGNWELGTRDTGAYATFSDVVSYFEWLGSEVSDSQDRRQLLVAASKAIHAQEKALTDAMLHGTGNLKGLADMERVTIIGGIDNPLREGLVALNVEGLDAADVVEKFNQASIRTHTRKADHYSGNVLEPLGLPSCVRVSLCHYNSIEEVERFLEVMRDIVADV